MGFICSCCPLAVCWFIRPPAPGAAVCSLSVFLRGFTLWRKCLLNPCQFVICDVNDIPEVSDGIPPVCKGILRARWLLAWPMGRLHSSPTVQVCVCGLGCVHTISLLMACNYRFSRLMESPVSRGAFARHATFAARSLLPSKGGLSLGGLLE